MSEAFKWAFAFFLVLGAAGGWIVIVAITQDKITAWKRRISAADNSPMGDLPSIPEFMVKKETKHEVA